MTPPNIVELEQSRLVRGEPLKVIGMYALLQGDRPWTYAICTNANGYRCDLPVDVLLACEVVPEPERPSPLFGAPVPDGCSTWTVAK